MEEQWYVDRCRLRKLWQENPDMNRRKLADRLGRSLSWVKKWLRRFRKAPADDQILHGYSRARKNPPPGIAPEVQERILEIRDEPPSNQIEPTPGVCVSDAGYQADPLAYYHMVVIIEPDPETWMPFTNKPK